MPPKRKKSNPVDDDNYAGIEDDDKSDQSKGKKSSKLRNGKSVSVNKHEETEPFQDYSRTLKLKPDHELRPVWITENNLIILEAFSPIYQQAYDFLVAVAEPESRPEFIHCYKLTENSLYAAVAVSIDTESIIKVLGRLCKTELPTKVVEYVRECTYTFGKAKIVLKDNSFYIESKYPEILRELLKNPLIRNSRITVESTDDTLPNGSANGVEGCKDKEGFLQSMAPVEDARNLDYIKLGIEMDGVDNDDDDDEEETGGGDGVMNLTNRQGYRNRLQTVSFMIAQNTVQV